MVASPSSVAIKLAKYPYKRYCQCVPPSWLTQRFPAAATTLVLKNISILDIAERVKNTIGAEIVVSASVIPALSPGFKQAAGHGLPAYAQCGFGDQRDCRSLQGDPAR